MQIVRDENRCIVTKDGEQRYERDMKQRHFLETFGEMYFRRDVEQDLNDFVVLVLLHAHMRMMKHRKLYYYWMMYHWIKSMDVIHLFKV